MPSSFGRRRFLALTLVALACVRALPAAAAPRTPDIKGPWRALHLLNYQTDADLVALEAQLPDLAARGVNVLVFEVDFSLEFTSHPELRYVRALSKPAVKRFVAACRKQGLHVIPQFQSFGHQSWAKETYPLLTVYPELDLTPGAYPGNEGIYCREWDPMNPRVYEIVYALLDEIIDTFEADAVHVGMDEVFLINRLAAKSTRDLHPADVYAKVVNDMYDHITRKRGRTMLMWADRLIDAAVHDYGEWESSKNGTAWALDRIPKDVILCDWHYEMRDSYPSVPMFLEKGFRVLPTSWKNVEASRKYIDYTVGLKHPQMLGHLFSMWSKQDKPAEWPPLVQNAAALGEAAGPR
jgi:hypothetical protein